MRSRALAAAIAVLAIAASLMLPRPRTLWEIGTDHLVGFVLAIVGLVVALSSIVLVMAKASLPASERGERFAIEAHKAALAKRGVQCAMDPSGLALAVTSRT